MEYETKVKEILNKVASNPEGQKVRKEAVDALLNLLGHAYELGAASTERSAYTEGVRDAYVKGLQEGFRISMKEAEE